MIRSAHFKTISEDFAKIITPAIEVHVLQMPELRTHPVWVETESQKTPPLQRSLKSPTYVCVSSRAFLHNPSLPEKLEMHKKKKIMGKFFLPITKKNKAAHSRTTSLGHRRPAPKRGAKL